MRLLSIMIFAFITNIAVGQSNLFTAIGKSDVATLSAQFSNDMEICIGTEQDFYSKAEAVKRLEKFFTEIGPKSSAFKHKGNNKDKTSEYSVGTMNTDKGKYRVFIYYEGDKVTGLMFNPE